jgi:hypothetical protein
LVYILLMVPGSAFLTTIIVLELIRIIFPRKP